MNNVKVTREEVVRHFLRTQSHKPELEGMNISDLSLEDAERVVDCKYTEIAKRMKQSKHWHFCFVDKSLFEALKALPTQTWCDLSEGSLRITDVAKNVMKKQGYADTRRKVLELMKSVTSERFDWRIILQFNGEDYTVLDGTCRAVAMVYHFDQHGFIPFLAYVGLAIRE